MYLQPTFLVLTSFDLLDDSTDSGNFSVGGCLPLVRKDSVTHMHGLAVYVKERLLFNRYLLLVTSF